MKYSNTEWGRSSWKQFYWEGCRDYWDQPEPESNRPWTNQPLFWDTGAEF